MDNIQFFIYLAIMAISTYLIRAIPFALAVLAVTSCTSLTADDCLARLRQTIEQGRLSHIRASYNGYQISHTFTPFSFTPSLLLRIISEMIQLSL